MTMFLIQSAILIAIAFVIGCIIGCLLRRMFAVEAMVPATVAVPAADLPQNVAQVPEPANVSPAQLIASPAVTNQPKPAPKQKKVTKPQVAAAPAPSAKSKTRTRSEPNQKIPETEASKASKPANTKPETGKPVSAKGKKPMAAKLAKPVGGKPDNLTLINGIGNVIERKLHDLGIFHFEQMAKWTKAEAEDVSKAVGFPGRAMRENWMKEAAIFMKGGTTVHARKVEAGDVSTSRKSTAVEKGNKK